MIVPPSSLFDGDGSLIGHYEDTCDSLGAPAAAPAWLIHLLMERPNPEKAAPQSSKTSALWAEAKLAEQCASVSDARRGSRNDMLNKAAFSVGQMIAMGALARGVAQEALDAAAQVCGLGEMEARATVNSGIAAGMSKAPERPFFIDKNVRGGVEIRSLHNVTAFLDWSGVTLRWNAFIDRYELTGVKGHAYLSDKSTAVLWGKAQEIGFRVDKGFLRDGLEVTALEHEVHPVRDHFKALRAWDGTPRLDNWLTAYLGADDTEYIQAVGAKTLIAGVRRIKRPGTKFDQLLILEGKQGTLKSSAAKCLAIRESWFTDCVSLTHDSKVMIEQTEGKFIVEVPELKGMRQGEIEQVKATLSRTHDRARKAYGHYTEDVPRQFILIGTANIEKAGDCWYLKDPTGNRRFWPVKTDEIDLKRLEQDRDQLWAEAVEREAMGEFIELPKELWKDAEREQQARMEKDPWVEELSNELGTLEGKLLTTDARLIITRNLERWGPTQDQRLGRAMRELGWERTYLRHEKGRAYFYVKGEEPLPKLTVTVESPSQVTVCSDNWIDEARKAPRGFRT